MSGLSETQAQVLREVGKATDVDEWFCGCIHGQSVGKRWWQTADSLVDRGLLIRETNDCLDADVCFVYGTTPAGRDLLAEAQQ